MDVLGINWGFLAIQFLMLGSWLLPSIFALFALRRSHLTGVNQVLWALGIIVIPVLGAMAFFIVKPGRENG